MSDTSTISDNAAANTTVNVVRDVVSSESIIGKIIVDELVLVQKNGNRIDLTASLYSELEFFEDIYSSSVSGTIRINDFSGGLEKFYISGGETLKVTILKANKTRDIIFSRSDFVVYRVGGAELTERLTTHFTLYFTTLAYVRSIKTKVYKSYENKSISHIIKDIYGKYIKGTGLLQIESSMDLPLQKPYVATGLSPLKVIEQLSKRACADGKFYTFFERLIPTRGQTANAQNYGTTHIFGSLNSFRTNDPTPIGAYKVLYSPSTELSAIVRTTPPGFIRATQFIRLDNFNHIDNMLSGLYHSRITTLNSISRTYSVKNISYAADTEINSKEGEFYSKNKILSGGNIFSEYSHANPTPQYPGEKLITSSMNDVAIAEDWLKHNMYGYSLPALYRVQVLIDGSTNKLSCGHTVDLSVPSKLYQVIKNQFKLDEMLSGKYICISARHTISNSIYTKRIELGRASLPVNLDAKFSTTISIQSEESQSTHVVQTDSVNGNQNASTGGQSNASTGGGQTGVPNNADPALPEFGADTQTTVTPTNPVVNVEKAENSQTSSVNDRNDLFYNPNIKFDDNWYRDY